MGMEGHGFLLREIISGFWFVPQFNRICGWDSRVGEVTLEWFCVDFLLFL